jgi:hypothetical protein
MIGVIVTFSYDSRDFDEAKLRKIADAAHESHELRYSLRNRARRSPIVRGAATWHTTS